MFVIMNDIYYRKCDCTFQIEPNYSMLINLKFNGSKACFIVC